MTDIDTAISCIPPGMGMAEVIKNRFLDHVVDVEFSCGECCKKAFGGKLAFIGSDFILLSRPDLTQPILVKAFSAGKLVAKEFVSLIFIPFEHVCSIEIRTQVC